MHIKNRASSSKIAFRPAGSLQAACAVHFTIPLRGLSESLNVSVAAAVALHWGRVAREAALGSECDLDPAELEVLRRDYRGLGRERGFQKGMRRTGLASGSGKGLAASSDTT